MLICVQRQFIRRQEIQSKLEGNAELLTGLKQAQNERLLKKAEVRRTVSEKELSLGMFDILLDIFKSTVMNVPLLI